MPRDKQHKIPNAPTLRFPEFSGEWFPTELQSLVPNISSGKDNIEDGVYTLYGSTGPIGTTSLAKYVEEILLVARVGANAGYLQIVNEPCGVTDNALVLNGKDWNHYLYYYLQHYNLNKLVFGSGQPLITGGMLKKIKVSCGDIAERNKIVELFQAIDERIEVQIGAIDKLESLIKSLAYKLTICKDVIGIADCVDCHSSTMQEKDVLEEGKYPVYGASGICGYTDTPMCNEPAILIVKDGSGVGSISFADGGFSILGTLNYLTAKDDTNIKYIYCCLLNFDFTTYKTGMAIPHIYFKDYGKGKIGNIQKNEQIKVAALIFTLRDKMSNEHGLLTAYCQQKQYLLSQMFV